MSNIKYLALFLFCIFLLFLCSCSAEYHMSQARKKKPELFQADTIRIHDTAYVELPITDTKEIDSLLSILMDCENDSDLTSVIPMSGISKKALANSTQKQRLKDRIKDLYKDKPCIGAGDTLIYTKGDIVVKLWQEGKGLKIAIDKKVTTEKANITESGLPKWVWPVIICMALFIGLLLFFRR